MAEDVISPEAEVSPESRVLKGKKIDTDAVVDQWVAEYFPDSIISRASAGWQHILTAVAVLKRRLKGA